MSKGKPTADGNSMLEAKHILCRYVQTKIKSVAVGHSETLNGRGESVRLKQLSVFCSLRQAHSATILKRWRGEESPSVYGGEDVNNGIY